MGTTTQTAALNGTLALTVKTAAQRGNAISKRNAILIQTADKAASLEASTVITMMYTKTTKHLPVITLVQPQLIALVQQTKEE